MNVEQNLFGIIGKQLGIGTDEISYKSNFMKDLGADSLDTIEIVMSIEEEFNIEELSEDDLKEFISGVIDDMVEAGEIEAGEGGGEEDEEVEEESEEELLEESQSPLLEQSKEDAKKENDEYKKLVDTLWIEEFFHNNNSILK